MSDSSTGIRVRPLLAQDIDAVVTIDALIRDAGKAITYANLTTGQVLTQEKKTGPFRRPTSYYLDLVARDAQGSAGIGFVAELESRIRGFIIAREESRGRSATRVGRILIIGVEPDFQRRGIAAQLVNALCERFRSDGIKEVKAEADSRDIELLAFLGTMGFASRHLIELAKTL